MKKYYNPIQIVGIKPQVTETLAPLTPEQAEATYGKQVNETLERVFGHKQFRSFQREVVLSVLARRDTFVLMPTGGGKSLCFQLPALVLPGVTLVVSPLIALMQDQVAALKSKGIAAECLNSSMGEKVRKKVYADLHSKQITTKLLYVTPEMIATPGFTSLMEELNNKGVLSSFVVDESHCISKWGVGFRPDYRKLDTFKERFSTIPVIALTATATKVVQDDVIASLKLKTPRLFITSFNRPNISYEVRFKDLISDLNADVKAFVDQNLKNGKEIGDKPCGIVYCHKRTDCDMVALFLKNSGYKAEAYHAGLSPKQRDQILTNFMSGALEIAVATIAFGMGIDRAAVRFVIHYTIPKSIEDFYQESGRGGRDGLPSKSLVYYSDSDRSLMEFLCSQTNPNLSEDENQRRTNVKLKAFRGVVEYCTEAGCRRKKLLSYFGENAVATGVNICNKTCDYCVDNGKRFREMTDELSAPKYQALESEYRYRAKGGRFDEDPIEDEYAYDSRHNRASTDDHDHDESGGAKGKPSFVLAASMKRATSALGHYERVAKSAPTFQANGDNDAFFAAFVNAEKAAAAKEEKTAARKLGIGSGGGVKTLGVKRTGFLGKSPVFSGPNTVTSGFTLKSGAKRAHPSTVDLDEDVGDKKEMKVHDLLDDGDGDVEPPSKKQKTSHRPSSSQKTPPKQKPPPEVIELESPVKQTDFVPSGSKLSALLGPKPPSVKSPPKVSLSSYSNTNGHSKFNSNLNSNNNSNYTSYSQPPPSSGGGKAVIEIGDSPVKPSSRVDVDVSQWF